MAVLTARADLATEPWPKVVREFPFEIPSALTQGGFRITISEPGDPEIRKLRGSGGPMLSFTVLNEKSGWKQAFYDQCVGARWLAPFEGHPQLEIWGRGGGGFYSRCLTRMVRGEYRCVRIDQFTNFRERSTQPSITTTLPRSGEVLYFIRTRMPEGTNGDLIYEDEK
ncbi:MAG: hypothetical protein B7Z37_31095 [Verrucomicrobia bacterium 12-59-8]|nr:MAG: hypothetical protein B7Z37_31095 [Verrucomicrobia bacterium 12-59-8]